VTGGWRTAWILTVRKEVSFRPIPRTVLTGSGTDVAAGLRREIEDAPATVRELLTHTEAAVGDTLTTIAWLPGLRELDHEERLLPDRR